MSPLSYDTPLLWNKLEKAKELFFIFDFDGTLVAIRRKPHEIQLRSETRKLLLALRSFAPIGVITGRSLEDFQKHCSLKLDFLSGTHGLESPFRPQKKTNSYSQAIGITNKMIHSFYPELLIEKKKIGFTIHFRGIQNSKPLFSSCRAFLRFFDDLKIIIGKKVLNVLPASPYSKGWVMDKLLKCHPNTTFIYVGDDVTDEDIFKIKSPQLISIRIGKSLKTKAPFFIPRQKEMDFFLLKTIARLSKGKHDGRKQASI